MILLNLELDKHANMIKLDIRISIKGVQKIFGMTPQTGTWTYHEQELAFLQKLNGVKLAFGKLNFD
jgi:hypothetical protein